MITFSEKTDAFSKGMAEVTKKASAVEKDGKGAFGGHATLRSAIQAYRPALAQHGFSVIQSSDRIESGDIVVETLILHASGQWVRTTCTLPPDKTALNRNPAQAVGSACTYGRRYSYMAAMCAFGSDHPKDFLRDDDGAALPTSPTTPTTTVSGMVNPASAIQATPAWAHEADAVILEALDRLGKKIPLTEEYIAELFITAAERGQTQRQFIHDVLAPLAQSKNAPELTAHEIGF